MLDCSHINNALGEFGICEETENGMRVITHCLYPSFEPVSVYVRRSGDAIVVSDAGGSLASAWHHGLEAGQLGRAYSKAATAFGCQYSQKSIWLIVENEEWLYSGIVSVANASSEAARSAVSKTRAIGERSLISKTKRFFDNVAWKPETSLEYQIDGTSGKVHTFDLAIQHDASIGLIDAVVPHANSIAAKYLAFADTESRMGLYKYAIYDSELSSEDKTLISGVADLVAYESVIGTDGKFLLQ
jgi:hypothetical protein